jgi:hypothetical protein
MNGEQGREEVNNANITQPLSSESLLALVNIS